MIDTIDAIALAAPLLRVTPTPLDEIAKVIGLPVEYAPLAEDLGSTIHRDGRQFRVLVNSNRSGPRQRWALARAISHVLLHGHLIRDRDVLQDSQASTTKLGLYADKSATRLAAELILPAAQIRQAWKSGIRDPDRLAQHFGVSLRATSDRLDVLRLSTP